MNMSDNDKEEPRVKKGWAGEEMEMSHRREQLRNTDHTRTSAQQYGTVNLEQFQNKEVGHGYQARGVIRQRTGLPSSNLNIVDMTMSKKNPQQEKDDTSASSSKEKRRKRKSKRKRSGKEIPTDPTEQFLRCTGLRDFRKELEKILLESKR
jgi:hypothetical protein